MFASTVLMVRPVDFSFNPETGTDNEFQNKPEDSAQEVTQQALAEFDAAVSSLRNAGIKVLILEDANDGIKRPDAVFPNNWFGTDESNTLYYFPMKTANRRAEVRPKDVEGLLQQNGYRVEQICFVGGVSAVESGEQVLEGTGSIIFDHKHKLAYAALSDRCQSKLLNTYVKNRGYQLIEFESFSSNGVPVYHTNVMLSVGANFVVVCLDAIPQQQRANVTNAIEASGKTLVDISFEQMEKHFCANILQLQNTQDELVIAMSKSAFQGFTEAQKAILTAQSELVVVDIDTIESVGGGSCRCMLAEVFNQKG